MELKECPFCGSDAAINKMYGMVYYTGCSVEFKADAFHGLSEMIEQWNRRFSTQLKTKGEQNEIKNY